MRRLVNSTGFVIMTVYVYALVQSLRAFELERLGISHHKINDFRVVPPHSSS